MNTVNEYERVIAALNAEADAKFKDFSSKIVNAGKPLIGVRTPTIKAIVKAMDDEKAKEYLPECKFEFFEDTLVYGLLIARMPFSEFKRYLPVYLSNADSWAHIDSFVASVKCVKSNYDAFFDLIKCGLFEAEGLFLRFKIIALMDYYIEKELNFILNLLEKIDKKGYYNDMAIAWLLSVAFVKRKTETEEYLKTDNLSAFTHNAAIRKICDSFRVAAQDKIEIKKYLRKK